MIKKINDNEIGYPPIAKKNSFYIINFLEENLENDKLYDILVSLKSNLNNMNNFSYEKYNTEYELKQNSLNLINKKSYTFWNLSDIEESLKCDFIIMLTLKSDKSDFVDTYLSNYLLDKNFIFSINKYIYALPKILSNKEIKRRVRIVLETNIKLLNDLDDELINILSLKKVAKTEDEIEVFKEMNYNTLIALNNLEKEPFTIDVLREYYDYLKVENYLYLDGDKRIDIDKEILIKKRAVVL